MRDAMVALGRRGVESAALVHRHSLSIRTIKESFPAGEHCFQVVRTGMWARFLFTPISPGFPRQFRHLIRSFKPDILHLHLPNPSVFWALLLPSARRLPWIVHWHSDVITSAHDWRLKLFYKFYRPFERAVLKRATAVVATSLPYRDSSQPLKEWMDKCHVIPLGVDADRFVENAGLVADGANTVTTDNAGPDVDHRHGAVQPVSWRDQPPPLKILAIGRLTYYKGFQYLIEAAAKSHNTRINIVGHGDQASRLKALSTSLDVQDRVTFHGNLSDAELAWQMSQCDCVCLPSIERTEAFGMVLLEAKYFGKATIVSDVPGSGMGWIVDDRSTGLKVEPANADALATAFDQLDNDREELMRMGQRGKEKFDQQFEINHAIEDLLTLYHQVVSEQNVQPG